MRHTRVAVEPGVCYGRTNVPVAETFAEEAAAVRAGLPDRPRLVWTSPATRCVRLAESLGGPLRVDERLWELNFGEWEGRRWETFHDARSDAWAVDPWNGRPPGGESGAEMSARVAAVREDIWAEARGGDGVVAVVAHAGVLRAWRHLTGRTTLEEAMAWPVPFGSVWPDELAKSGEGPEEVVGGCR
ncbi:histidine phosphatase family protein [Actomonas aquatica]|uniref:Histidine phosphatase family protein n=1 Tax=Actomonas aquatica TaxID=2866162 RepID=A0ABZ1CDT0_9BACT|nr:histidine phosphatase family protein [Opitutus sp. WL0086]WRQ89719.1 histidine phosphatase family protein [Opitutus sp. WL0086]